jgi:hypothetical protein
MADAAIDISAVVASAIGVVPSPKRTSATTANIAFMFGNTDKSTLFVSLVRTLHRRDSYDNL